MKGIGAMPSDWDADPIDIEQPNSPATNTAIYNKTNKQSLLSNFGNKRTKVRTRPSSFKTGTDATSKRR